MTDLQILTLALTLAIALIIPQAALIYSNSRVSDMKNSIGHSINEARETLRADNATMRAEILAAIERLDTKIETKLLVHELEHHRK